MNVEHARDESALKRNSKHVYVAAAVLLLQLGLLTFTIPLGDLIGTRSFFYIDNPYHLYQIELGRAFIEKGRLIGYDPFFGGGNIGGMMFNVSARLPVLISALLPASVSTRTIYAAYVFCCALLAPLAIVAATFILRWSFWPTVLAASFALLYWWIGPFRWYHTAGMVSYVCACYLSVAYAVWTWDICTTTRTIKRCVQIALAGIAGGLCLWLHPLFGVLAPVMFLAFAAANYRRIHFKRLLSRAVPVGAIALVLNLPWVVVALGAGPILKEQVYQRQTGINVLLHPLFGLRGDSLASILHPIIFLVCLSGFFVLNATRRRELLPLILAATAFLIFSAFGGASETLASLQPNRFMPAGFLMLTLGAGLTAGTFVEHLFTRYSIAPRWISVSLVFGLLFALPVRELMREISPKDLGHHGKVPPEMTNLPPDVDWLRSWIASNTTNEGRLLFETSLARIHGGGHVAGYLALATQREFIGAAYPYMLADVSFWDHFGFDKKLNELSVERFRQGIELENVGWIVAHSNDLVRLIAKAPEIKLIAQRGPIRVFVVGRALSYIQSGKGKVVSRGIDRVTVTGASGTSLVLRYRWVPGLHAFPAAKLEAEEVSPDFPRMIRVLDPPPEFTLSLGHG